EADLEACRAAGVDMVFAPDTAEVYPPGFQTHVEPGPLALPLCGAFRPGHFRGVLTVVAKLFSMVGPYIAFFGQKDFQQSVLIRRMAEDLDFPVEVSVVATVRESDGIAMSSRNAYLDDEERRRARGLSRGLFAAQNAFSAGERRPSALIDTARAEMAEIDS